MKQLNLTAASIVSTALWFGASVMLLTALILLFWSAVVSSVSVVPALGWSFVLGAVVGVLIWHVPLINSTSYATAAVRGALIGPLSLLAALASSTLVDALVGNLKEVENISWVVSTIVYAVALTLGVPIIFLSTLSGVAYAFIKRRTRAARP